MTVYVITNGDYPQGVLENQSQALALVEANNAKERLAKDDRLAGYWRVHPFELNKVPS